MAVHGVYVSERGDRIGAWAHSTLGIRGWIFLGRLPPPPPGQNPKEAPAVQSGHAHAPGAAEAPLGCFARAAFPPRGGPGGGHFPGGQRKKGNARGGAFA